MRSAGALKEASIPFVPAVSTMMLWMDLRKGLRGGATWAAERDLWHRLANTRHVILTPGMPHLHPPSPFPAIAITSARQPRRPQGLHTVVVVCAVAPKADKQLHCSTPKHTLLQSGV